MIHYCNNTLGQLFASAPLNFQIDKPLMTNQTLLVLNTLRSAIFHRDQFWDMQYYAKINE